MSKSLVNDLNKYGVCVLDNFLGEERGRQVLEEVEIMNEAGIFENGKVVSNRGDARNVRGDKVAWVNGLEPAHRSLGYLIRQVSTYEKHLILSTKKNCIKYQSMNYFFFSFEIILGR